MTAPTGQMAIPPGMCCITTHGSILGVTTQAWMDMRSFSEKQGLVNVRWDIVNGTLVEKARNDAVRQMLRIGAQWLLFLDGDMNPPPDSLIRLLQHAYQPNSPIDVIGGYCTLKGEWSLPTIDTGTGTWESWFPGSGVVEVIRTGAAFLLIKRHVFERLPDPWFRMRVPTRPLDAMLEVDNWARIKLNGKNPFKETSEWKQLEQLAMADPSLREFVPAEVGEDSGFCDRVKAAGMRIFVDTDTVVGHLEMTTRTAYDHKQAIDKAKTEHRQLVGLMR